MGPSRYFLSSLKLVLLYLDASLSLSAIERMITELKEKYHHWVPIVNLSSRRLQKEEALKARVVKANETGEKEKVFISRFYTKNY